MTKSRKPTLVQLYRTKTVAKVCVWSLILLSYILSGISITISVYVNNNPTGAVAAGAAAVAAAVAAVAAGVFAANELEDLIIRFCLWWLRR